MTYRDGGKRLVDVVLTCACLPVALPLMAFVAAVVRLRLGSPVLFRQQRPGRGGRPFTLLKFRTMRDARRADGHPLADEARLTPLGRTLRSTSLDELPELLNVLKGEMSLVGPRPLLMAYVDRYDEEHARRHDVRPGITGWAQVNGRNAISWDEKFARDVWYVDHLSPWIDVKILARTVWQVVSRRGVSAPGSATMPEFMGRGRCS